MHLLFLEDVSGRDDCRVELVIVRIEAGLEVAALTCRSDVVAVQARGVADGSGRTDERRVVAARILGIRDVDFVFAVAEDVERTAEARRGARRADRQKTARRFR